jgi:hypothetical protein
MIQLHLSNEQNATIPKVLHVSNITKFLLLVYKVTLQLCHIIELLHNYYSVKISNNDGETIDLQFNQLDNLYPLPMEIVPKNTIGKHSTLIVIKWHHPLRH